MSKQIIIWGNILGDQAKFFNTKREALDFDSYGTVIKFVSVAPRVTKKKAKKK